MKRNVDWTVTYARSRDTGYEFVIDTQVATSGPIVILEITDTNRVFGSARHGTESICYISRRHRSRCES